LLATNRVGVEKLFPAKFAKTKLRQDALQTTFSVFLDIFYSPNFRCFDENGVFQQPQAITRFDLEVISSAIPATGFDPDASVRVRAPRQELLRANGLDAQRHAYPEMWDRER
jgi:hypothetical protein